MSENLSSVIYKLYLNNLIPIYPTSSVVNKNVTLSGQLVFDVVTRNSNVIIRSSKFNKVYNNQDSRLVASNVYRTDVWNNNIEYYNDNNSFSTVSGYYAIINGYNSYSNLPSPVDKYISENSNMYPTLYYNNNSYVWGSDKNHGYILSSLSLTLPDNTNLSSLLSCYPYDLQGYKNKINVTGNSAIIDLSGYYNYLFEVDCEKSSGIVLVLKNCIGKIVLKNKIFKKLVLLNCSNVKLHNINFDSKLLTLNTTTKFNQFKSRTELIPSNNITKAVSKQIDSNLYTGLVLSNSVAYLLPRRKTLNLKYSTTTFKNYDICVLAANGSKLYMFDKSTTQNYNIDVTYKFGTFNNRPITFCSLSGSSIYYNSNVRYSLSGLTTWLTYLNDSFKRVINDDFTTNNYLSLRDEVYSTYYCPVVLNFNDLNSIINHNHKQFDFEYTLAINLGILTGATYFMISDGNGNIPYNSIGAINENPLFRCGIFEGYNGSTNNYPNMNHFSNDTAVTVKTIVGKSMKLTDYTVKSDSITVKK